MTAFARRSTQAPCGVLTWELRAVNHRFLDVSIRLPDALRSLEPAVREKLSEKCQRGKIEVSLKISPGKQALPLAPNESMIQQLSIAGEKVSRYFPSAQIDILSVLNWPGVLNTESLEHEILNADALNPLEEAIEELVQMRRREGAQIKTFIQQRLHSILQVAGEVQEKIPELLAAERQRMTLRLAEISAESDPQRLEQEMALLIQKADIAEEIQRLNSHCLAMSDALNQSGAIGRRLDFLSQELHREANTLSSKALNIALIRAGVEMKVLIEQIREQVQNIE